MKNKILILGIMFSLLIPISVNAKASITLSCDKTKLKANEETTCTITGIPNEGGNINAFDITVEVAEGLTADVSTKYINDDKWYKSDEDFEDNRITTMGVENIAEDEYYTNPMELAKFKIKASNTTSGIDSKVTLKKIELSVENEDALELNDYNLDIRVMSSVNTLKQLTVSGTTFTFDKNKTTYDLTVDSDSVTITAEKEEEKQTVSGTGTKELNYGLNTFNVKVTSEDGTEKVYTLNITREDNRSKDNYLTGIKFIDYDIDFNKDKTEYNIVVDNNIKNLYMFGGSSLDITLEDMLLLDTTNIKYDENAKINWFLNDNNINEFLSDIFDLSTCDEDEEKGEEKCYYENNDNSELTYFHNNAYELYLLGNLNVGNNIFKIVVTAENEEERVYTFNINRKDINGNIIEDKTDEEAEEIPTGNIQIIIVSIIMIIALIIALVVAKKKDLFNKIIKKK